MSEVRILPHPKVFVDKWDADGYPASIVVKMSDNTEMEFVREIKQPQPQCVKAVELIRTMKGHTYGGYKGKHTKK